MCSCRTCTYGCGFMKRAARITPCRAITVSNRALAAHIDGAGLAADPKGPLFRTSAAVGRTHPRCAAPSQRRCYDPPPRPGATSGRRSAITASALRASRPISRTVAPLSKPPGGRPRNHPHYPDLRPPARRDEPPRGREDILIRGGKHKGMPSPHVPSRKRVLRSPEAFLF